MSSTWRQTRRLQKYLINPPFKVLAYLGYPAYHAIVETVGRRSGYVRNIAAEPRIRLLLRRRWHGGRAMLLPDDDAQARLDSFDPPGHAQAVRRFATGLLTIRVDLSN